MHSYLKTIIDKKRIIVDELLLSETLLQLLDSPYQIRIRPSFEMALLSSGLQVIAEVKRQSPSKGQFGNIHDPIALAKQYQSGGAAAISVLTDKAGFGGSLADLNRVAASIQLPILRKDFIINPIQLAETALSGASAVLLITSLIGKDLAVYLTLCEQLGLNALVEVHTKEECQLALDAGAKIIGINNRDLTTFKVDIQTAMLIKKMIPSDICTIAESGIQSVEVAQAYAQMGFDAVLVGEYLVKSADPAVIIQACRGLL